MWPVFNEAVADPFAPPMPPNVTLDQVNKLAVSLARSESNREQILLTALADMVHEFF